MRTIFLFGVIAAAAFLAGWFNISRDDEHTTIKFNRDEIRNDTRVAIDRGREILNKKLQPSPQDEASGYASQQGPYSNQFDSNQFDPNQPAAPSSQYWPEDRTASNPQGDRRGNGYPQPTQPQPTQWQQPQAAPYQGQYQGGPYQGENYPAQPRDYQVPRQY